jgi:RNA-directed DNA polymerase
MARYQGPQLVGRVESLLEEWMGLTINRSKTRVVDLKDQGTSLDFLGYTFPYQNDHFGRQRRYLNVSPSAKALNRERAAIHERTSCRYAWVPIPRLIHALNRHRKGWANSCGVGHPRKAFAKINQHVQWRVAAHLKRRSQRAFRPPEGVSLYHHLTRLGLVRL